MERGNGDGAHDVPESIIDYATRTVQVHVAAMGGDRGETLREWDKIRQFAHRMVRLRLVDDTRDAYVEGMFQLEGPGEWEKDWMQGVLTVVCNRPEILATVPSTGQMLPVDAGGRGQGGLSYNQKLLSTHWEGEPNNSVSVLQHPDLAGIKGLRYPLTYAAANGVVRQNQVTLVNNGTSRAYPVFTCHGPMPDGVDLKGLRYPLTYAAANGVVRQNQVTLVNNGTSRAYPVFTCHGPMPDGVDLVVEGTGLWLKCTQPVYGEPLVLDCRSRTASVGGLDVSRTLQQRGFPVVGEGTGLWLKCTQPVYGEPLVLDCRSRTASVGGLDVSRTLQQRGFPVVGAQSSITVTLRNSGGGFVDALVRDTYM